MGRIELEVLFGGKDNHRRKPIWFEVVDLNSPYHALLGRPALAKFMAVPHYAYLKMKLPGPRGVITVTGCYKKSIECTRVILQVDVGDQRSLCVVNDQPVGNPKRKV
jgi:hypothetical protein